MDCVGIYLRVFLFLLLSRVEMLYGWFGSCLLGATDGEILKYDAERLILVYASYLNS